MINYVAALFIGYSIAAVVSGLGLPSYIAVGVAIVVILSMQYL